MHTLNRLVVLCLLLMLALPAGMLALIVQPERDERAVALQDAIETAAVRYRQRGGLQATQAKAQEMLVENERELAKIQREKRVVRLRMGAMKKQLAAIEKTFAVSLTDAPAIEKLLTQRKDVLTDALQQQYRLDQLSGLHAAADASFLGRDTGTLRKWSIDVIERDTRDAIAALSSATEIDTRFVADATVLSGMQKRYLDVLVARDNAYALKTQTEAQLSEIRRITAEVHEQVLALQGELARIDARIRRRAERALIEKGLLEPEEVTANEARDAKVAFSLPVYGRTTAGFRNASYAEHFGVPHHGLDIAVPQSTPVAAAADGVVFLVRDGGQKGYTYVLIGHRGGYATLYGHLSAVSVTAGQDISAGQLFALSGGKPGTRGAGPMTTGSHLHFEVLLNGVNIDPESVLP